MNPETPVLMIALQIPVLEDTTAAQVIEAIGEKVGKALEEIRQQQAAPDPEAIPQEEFRETVLKETTEAYTDATRPDLLTRLGYVPDAGTEGDAAQSQ